MIAGLRHLARLLEAPGREFHALDLVRLEEGSAAPTPRPEPGLEADGLGDAGNVLDPQAKAAYRQRLADLQEELDEAESWNDPERADRARQEIEFLTAELAGGVGLGGRDRRAASAAERARLNVTRAIRSAMTRIAEHHPQLGAHLDATIKTGLYCSYTPDTRNPPRLEPLRHPHTARPGPLRLTVFEQTRPQRLPTEGSAHPPVEADGW